MADVLRYILQALAALLMVGFFLLAALVIFGTLAACFRWRRPPRRVRVATYRPNQPKPAVRTQPEDPPHPATAV